MKKRLLSMLLTLTMVLSLFPGMTITASAETEGTPEETGTTVNLDFSDSGIPNLVVGGELSGSIVDKAITTTTEGFSASTLYWCKKPTSGGDWVQCNTGDIVKSGYNYGFVVAIVADEGFSLEGITGVTTNKGTVDTDSVVVQDGCIYATISVNAENGHQITLSKFSANYVPVPSIVSQGNSVRTPYYADTTRVNVTSDLTFEWSTDPNREGAWDRQMGELRVTKASSYPEYYVWNENTPAGTYYFRVIYNVHGVDGPVRSQPYEYVISAPNIKIKTESSIYIKKGEEIPKPLGVEADGQTALLEDQYIVEFKANGAPDADWSADWSALEAVVNGYDKGQSGKFDFRVTVVPDRGTSYTGSATQTVTIGIKAAPKFDPCNGDETATGTPPAVNPTHSKGYTFGGWYTKSNGRGESANGTYEDGMTYYARWVKDGMTVCFSTLNFNNIGSETSAGFDWDAGLKILTLNGLYMDVGSGERNLGVKLTHSQWDQGRDLYAALMLPADTTVKFSGTNTINATYSIGSSITEGNLCDIYCAGKVTFEGLTSDAKIVVRNTGTATNRSIGLFVRGDMIVNGGTLDIVSANVKHHTNEHEITGSAYGIYCLGTLKVTAGTINATGALAQNSYGVTSEFIEVSGGIVNGYSADIIDTLADKTIFSCGVNVTGCSCNENAKKPGHLTVTGGEVNGYGGYVKSTTKIATYPNHNSYSTGICVNSNCYNDVLNVSGGKVYGEAKGVKNYETGTTGATAYSIGVLTSKLNLTGGEVMGKGGVDTGAWDTHYENYGVYIGTPRKTFGMEQSFVTGGQLIGLEADDSNGYGIYVSAQDNTTHPTLVAGPGYIEGTTIRLDDGFQQLQQAQVVGSYDSSIDFTQETISGSIYVYGNSNNPAVIAFGPILSVSGASTNSYVYSLGENAVTFDVSAICWTNEASEPANVVGAKAELYFGETVVDTGEISFGEGEYTATVTGVDLAGLSVGDYVLRVTATNPADPTAVVVSNYSFTITPQPMTGAVVAEGDYVYNGGAHTPVVTVVDGVKDTDYELSYSNNTNAGTATVTVTYKGNYTGTETLNFTIQKKTVTVSVGDFAPIEDQVWTGNPITISELMLGETKLTANTEYTAVYENNTNVGEATMKVTLVNTDNIEFGVADGEHIVLNFNIKKGVSDEMVTVDSTNFGYDGTVKNPAVTVKDGETVLTLGTDYTVSVKDNAEIKNAGEYTVIISGCGNYTGKVEVTVTVAAKVLPADDTVIKLDGVNADAYAPEYTGEQIKPVVTVFDGENQLSEDDFDVTYGENTNAGAGTVTITFTGNYSGTAAKTFTIAPKTVTVGIKTEVVEVGTPAPETFDLAFSGILPADQSKVENLDLALTFEVIGDTSDEGTLTVNWTSADADKATIAEALGSNYAVSVNATGTLEVMYFVWTVTFTDGVNEFVEIFDDEPTEFELPECLFTAPEGMQFKAWKVNGVEYAAGATITVNGNMTITAVWEVIPTDDSEGEDSEIPTYSVTVIVKEETSSEVYNVCNDATVILVSPDGTEQKEAKRYGNGVYFFEDIKSGRYNVVVTKEGKIKTVLVTVDENTSRIEINLPLMVINSKVDVTVSGDGLVKGAMVGRLDNLAEQLAGEVEKAPDETVSVEVAMKIDTQMSESVDPDQKKDIEKEAKSQSENLTFLDIKIDLTITRKKSGEDPRTETEDIHNTSDLLEIVIPFDTTDKTDFAVYRHHAKPAEQDQNTDYPFDEKVQKLTKDANSFGERIVVDRDNGTITMYVRYFSTYAIGYSVKSATSDKDDETPEAPQIPVIPNIPSYPTMNPSYSVNVAGGYQGGTVIVSGVAAAKGATVTFTVTPDNGYELATLSVLDSYGIEIGVTEIGGGKYTFVMPDGQVFIHATFRAVEKVCTKGTDCPIWPYKDASTTAWYHDGVHYCIENGLMNGMTTTQFAPGGTTTRAQIVTILWRLEGQPRASYAMSFNDVAAGQWYTEAVRWAARNGIVDGYSDTVFAPNDAITREQMAAILWRYCQFKGIDVSVGKETNILSYTDAFTVHSWAMPAMQWACGAGVIGGIADGNSMKLDPSGSATRAQAATMLWRFCTEIVEP